MSDEEKIALLRGLLRDALEWLDDYALRMAGSAKLADRIRDAIDDATG